MKSFYLLLIAFYFLFPASASAARLFFATEQKQFVLGQLFRVELMLDPQGEVINAVEAELLFSEHLVLEKVDYGNSVISLWAKSPLLGPAVAGRGRDDKQVAFSGVIPGGFRGLLSSSWSGYRPGPIMTLSFIPRRAGRATVELGNARVLLHDGRGTQARLTVVPLVAEIKDGGSVATSTPGFPVGGDLEPPEPFTPIVSRSDNIFGGRWFVSFAAQDKQSGIARFEVAEKRGYKEAVSPYLLRDQKLASFIYVKAVDQNGNERVAVVPPRYPAVWYERGMLWSIIILALIGASSYWLWLKKRKA